MKSKLLLSASCALFTLLVSSATAAVLVDYRMTAFGAAPNSASTGTAYSTDANVTVTSLVNQAGQFPTGSENYNGGTDRVSYWSTVAGSTGTYANAFNAGNTGGTTGSFLAFQITANAGYEVGFTSITFQVAAGTSSSSDRAFYLVSETSPANFSATSTVLATDRTLAGAGTIPYQTTPSANGTVPQSYTVDLTSLAGLAEGETRYFRFYLQTPTANQSLAFDDIVVNGTVSASAIPEPSTTALLAGTAILVGTVTRRRQRI